MQNRNAFERRTFAAMLCAAAVCMTYDARADDKAECSAAYDKVQSFRREGKLNAARQQAAICTRDACAEFVRTDCTRWLNEIEQGEPTVVFEVHDAHGGDVQAVRITLDGEPWLDQLDGSAKPIDPGRHVLQYAILNQQPIVETIQIRQGEKNRKLTVSFQKTTSAPVGAVASPSPAPWVVMGVGLASLAAGSITGGLVLHEKSIVETECNAKTKLCTPKGASAADTGRTLGPVTTVALVLGGVGVTTGTIWLIARSAGAKDRLPAVASMGTALTMSGAGATWRLEGTW